MRSLKIQSSGYSRRNTIYIDKPNEDYYCIDDKNMIYGVFDGVSRDRTTNGYPNPSPSKAIAYLCAQYMHNYLIKRMQSECLTEKSLKESLIYANNKIKKHNSHSYYKFLPGTVCVICHIAENILYYAYVGDCAIRIINCKKVNTLSIPQTRFVQQNKSQLDTYQIRYNICNNPNHPYGYGVINGDNFAEKFIITGSRRIVSSNVILLSSDGAEEYINDLTADQILDMSPEVIINNSYASEEKSDDKTIIKVAIL